MNEIRRLLDRTQPGSRAPGRIVREHITRGEQIRAGIEARWGIGSPWQWRVKHVRWWLERGMAGRSPSTRYAHYRTVRAISAALGRWNDWEPHLRGTWQRPTGEPGRIGLGRPAQLPRNTR